MDTKSIDSLLCTLLAEGTGWRGKGDGIPAPSVITVLSLNSHFIAQWPPFFAESAKTESEAGLRPRGLVHGTRRRSNRPPYPTVGRGTASKGLPRAATQENFRCN